MKITQPMNEMEARDQAIEWQIWQADEALSYDEMLQWQNHFESVAKHYDLTEEFEENGII